MGTLFITFKNIIWDYTEEDELPTSITIELEDEEVSKPISVEKFIRVAEEKANILMGAYMENYDFSVSRDE